MTILTWHDLTAHLDHLVRKQSMQAVGLRWGEITDLVQAQLALDHPDLAKQMARVIELRFTNLGAVAYLRTGIPAGKPAAVPDAGALLIALRQFDPQSGDVVYMKYPRIKRLTNWRANLERRVRELSDDLRLKRRTDRQVARQLCDLFRLTQDDMDLRHMAAPQPGEEPLWAPVRAKHVPPPEPPSRVSLPVLLSVLAGIILLASAFVPSR